MAIFTKQLRKHIFVHPGDQHKLESAIKIALLKDRRKYLDSLDGALLDVHRIQMVGRHHLIVNGYISMEVVADFEVFSPAIGVELEGIINKKNGSNYGCVVKGLFNAYLHAPNESDFTAKEGDNCTFTVTKVIVSGDIVFMNGRLKSVTPLVGPNDIKSDQQFCSPTETQQFDSCQEVEDLNLKNEDNLESKDQETPKTKKKKKSRRSEDNECVINSNVSVSNGGDASHDNQYLKTESSDEIHDTKFVRINGEVKSIKTESMESVGGEGDINSSSKRKHKKKKISECDSSHDTHQFVSVKLEPGVTDNVENYEMETLENKSKKKKKRKHSENGDLDSSVNGETPVSTETSRRKRKRKSTDEGEVSTGGDKEVDRKPVVGVDVPDYSPSKAIKHFKQEKVSPGKVTNIKSEPSFSPPKKKIKKEK